MGKRLQNSQLTNFKTYNMYRREMLTLAENVFEFKYLPEYIDVAYMNKILLREGSIAFFYEEELESVVALPYANIGTLDMYGRPKKIQVYGQNGYHRMLNRGEFVIMYDNNGRYPLYMDIMQMAERIALNKRIIDINITQQKTPRIWKTSTELENSVKAILNDIDGNVESVFGYDSVDYDDIQGVMQPAPFVADKINDNLHEEWSEFFRLIGIANIQLDKKERLITDEMKASQGGTIASRYSRFNPRKKAIDEINKKWNTKIEVEYYDGLPTSMNDDTINPTGESEDDSNDIQ